MLSKKRKNLPPLNIIIQGDLLWFGPLFIIVKFIDYQDRFNRMWFVSKAFQKTVELSLPNSGFDLDKHCVFRLSQSKTIEFINKRIISNDPTTLLLNACKQGYSDLVKLLLKDKKTTPSAFGNCAMVYAIRYNWVKIVNILLKDGRCDPSYGNNKHVLHHLECGTPAVLGVLQDKRVIETAMQFDQDLRPGLVFSRNVDGAESGCRGGREGGVVCRVNKKKLNYFF